MHKAKTPNMEIIEKLKKHSLDAYGKGFLLESGIIAFQTVEALLRLAIVNFGRINSISESNLKKCSENEISFSKLIFFLDIIKPDNEISEKLKNLNGYRNRIIHKIFYETKSIEKMKKDLDKFTIDCVNMNVELRKLIGLI